MEIGAVGSERVQRRVLVRVQQLPYRPSGQFGRRIAEDLGRGRVGAHDMAGRVEYDHQFEGEVEVRDAVGGGDGQGRAGAFMMWFQCCRGKLNGAMLARDANGPRRHLGGPTEYIIP